MKKLLSVALAFAFLVCVMTIPTSSEAAWDSTPSAPHATEPEHPYFGRVQRLSERGLARAEKGSNVYPATYNEHDTAALRAWLEQTNTEGVKNGDLLNPDYDPNDPTTWIDVNMYDPMGWLEI